MNYLWAFVIGGAICVIGQLLIDYTSLSPGAHPDRLCGGGGGAQRGGDCTSRWWTWPVPGPAYRCWGSAICWPRGVRQAVDQCGLPGIFTGGLTAASGGIAASLLFALAAALVGKSRDQN